MPTLRDFFESHGLDEESGWDLLHHQGMPKKLAFESMPALVRLDASAELWTLIGLVGANAEPGIRKKPEDVKTKFSAALREAEARIVHALRAMRAPRSDEDTIRLLAALAGVMGLPDAHRQLDEMQLHGAAIEHYCPRCGAYLLLERDGLQVEVTWQGQRRRCTGGAVAPELARLATRARDAGHEDVSTFVEESFGRIECPRCHHAFFRIGVPPTFDGLPRDQAASGETTVSGATEGTARAVARLRAIAIESSKDAVVLPGVGLLTVDRYQPYSGRNPTTGEPVRLPAKYRVGFRVEPSLVAWLNGEAPRAHSPSDEPPLDELANEIRNALSTHDAVTVPELGVFALLHRPGRNGFDVDDEPIVIADSRSVAFRPAESLARAVQAER